MTRKFASRLQLLPSFVNELARDDLHKIIETFGILATDTPNPTFYPKLGLFAEEVAVGFAYSLVSTPRRRDMEKKNAGGPSRADEMAQGPKRTLFDSDSSAAGRDGRDGVRAFENGPSRRARSNK